MLLGSAKRFVSQPIKEPIEHRVQLRVRASGSEFAGYFDHGVLLPV